ncbi:hypothetical protein [uncultured Aureimonas sp.]|uniref:hypothetical protein n=1 Tax=uncultured Aureimonas sp. TaxID=1604662 RepID=UPI0025D2B8ED|nr:hypothetical protein [uncultured Aureimonas sp.]
MSTNSVTDLANAPMGASFPADAVRDPIRLKALDGLGILDTPAEHAFDAIVAVACEICEMPIALVSLLDRERQWFKARVGFEPAETTLDRSIFAFTLGGSEILVIPDLTLDARSAVNPLVTGPEAIRF